MKIKNKLSNNQKRQISLLLGEAKRAFLAGHQIKAQTICNKILTINPTQPDASLILGKAIETCGELNRARDVFESSHKIHRNHLGLIAALAFISGKLEDYGSSIHYWQLYTKLAPNSGDAWQALSASLVGLGHWKEAEPPARMALKLGASNISAIYANLGHILHRLHRQEEALPFLRKAVDLDPANTTAWFNLAESAMEGGELNEAMDAYTKLTILEPLDAVPIFNLIRFQKVVSYNNVMQIAEKFISNPDVDDRARSIVKFGLGKAWADLKDHDKAFFYYNDANNNWRKDLKYNKNDIENHIETIKTHLTSQLIADKSIADTSFGKEFIFIVGMPRSGSTLCAQILMAHPDAIDIGETDFLRKVLAEATGDAKGAPNIMALAEMTPEQLNKIALQYKATVSKEFGNATLYIDKTLPNFLTVGIIKMLFPNAKIINSCRNPIDNCMSIFSNSFGGDAFNYAYSLEEIGHYYHHYEKLMKLWQTLLPEDSIFRLVNEQLVADPEKVIRSLIGFCGIEWDDAFMNYHASKRIVKTQSLAQVREPINANSVGRWKPYKEHIQPLLDALGETQMEDYSRL